jgi:hypothetical protein
MIVMTVSPPITSSVFSRFLRVHAHADLIHWEKPGRLFLGYAVCDHNMRAIEDHVCPILQLRNFDQPIYDRHRRRHQVAAVPPTTIRIRDLDLDADSSSTPEPRDFPVFKCDEPAPATQPLHAFLTRRPAAALILGY